MEREEREKGGETGRNRERERLTPRLSSTCLSQPDPAFLQPPTPFHLPVHPPHPLPPPALLPRREPDSRPELRRKGIAAPLASITISPRICLLSASCCSWRRAIETARADRPAAEKLLPVVAIAVVLDIHQALPEELTGQESFPLGRELGCLMPSSPRLRPLPSLHPCIPRFYVCRSVKKCIEMMTSPCHGPW